jgi:hypothetical protein
MHAASFDVGYFGMAVAGRYGKFWCLRVIQFRPPAGQCERRQAQVGMVVGAIEFQRQQQRVVLVGRGQHHRDVVLPGVGFIKLAGETGGCIGRAMPVRAAVEAEGGAGALREVQRDIVQIQGVAMNPGSGGQPQLQRCSARRRSRKG